MHANGFRQITRDSVADLSDNLRSLPDKIVIVGEALQTSHLAQGEVAVFTAVEQENVFSASHAVHPCLDGLGRPVEFASRMSAIKSRARNQPVIVVIDVRCRWWRRKPRQRVSHCSPRGAVKTRSALLTMHTHGPAFPARVGQIAISPVGSILLGFDQCRPAVSWRRQRQVGVMVGADGDDEHTQARLRGPIIGGVQYPALNTVLGLGRGTLVQNKPAVVSVPRFVIPLIE